MTINKIKFITLLLALSFAFVQAQSVTKTVDIEVQETFAKHLGTTPALSQLIPIPPTDQETRKQMKLFKKAPENFKGSKQNKLRYPERQHIGPDPIRQSAINTQQSTNVEPIVNVDGLASSFGSPHDPTGDIGKDHYLQAINVTSIGVFDKEGNLLNTFTANTLWSPLGTGSRGDPIILYDQEVDRWLITEFSNTQFALLIAISKTADPLGEWDVWSFLTPNFPDYPKYGIWNNAYSVTTNEEGTSILPAYFINREALLNGADVVPIQRITFPGATGLERDLLAATPADWTGLTPPKSNPTILVLKDASWGGGYSEDAIEVYSVDIDWNNPDCTTATNTVIFTSPYDSHACAASDIGPWGCIPQMNGEGIFGVPHLIMNQVIYRNFSTYETMVLNFMTDVDGNDLSGIRWVELRKYPGEEWELYQEGTFSPADGLHRFMGSIAMDGAGNIGLAYNVSGENSFVGIRFTGRRANDPLGQMTVEEFVVVEGTTHVITGPGPGERFGDYAHMSIDPTNDRTFWYTSEYAGGANNKTVTRIVAFELRRDTFDIGPVELVSPVDDAYLGDSETVSVRIKNQGLDTVENFTVGYIFEGGVPVIEMVNQVLPPDSVYLHTFGSTVDMPIVGDYQLVLFTDQASDQVTLTDTLHTLVTKLPRWDAGIASINGRDVIICDDFADFTFTLTNFGAEVLTSATITVELNGSPFQQPIQWMGNLAAGASEDVPITITGLLAGTNTITVTISNPNGIPDERTSNDTISKPVETSLSENFVTFMLNTDNLPEQTSWRLERTSGIPLFSGGPYPGMADTTITERWCLDSDICYNFRIIDSGGNGICCDFGEGTYSLVDEDGKVLINSSGEFGGEEVHLFCLNGDCVIELDVSISNESINDANDGVIMVSTINGAAPFEYSIDGEMTFQDENVFPDLAKGIYEVVVRDVNGCTATKTAEVERNINTASNDLDNTISIKISPNPSSGVFSIEVRGMEGQRVFLPVAIFDQQGKLVYERQIGRFNEVYTGMFSLYAFPAGIYYLKVYDEEGRGMRRLTKIVKQ